MIYFPEDTDVAGAAVADATGVTFTSGISYDSGNAATVTDVVDTDDRTVKITLNTFSNTPQGIGDMAYVQVVVTGVVNPTDPGVYTLEVDTNEEKDNVESEEYDIEVPTVGGVVSVYNPSDVLLATYGGQAALDDVEASGHLDSKDYTITVGVGTYLLTGDVNITGKGVTLKSGDGAEDTIIDADGYSIVIDYVDATDTGEDVVIDGFTIDDADEAIIIDADDATVKNCVITDATVAGVQIDPAGTDATVADCVIEDCAIGVYFNTGGAICDLADVDITGNEITETSGNGGIVLDGGSEDIDIKGNTITGNDNSGIYFTLGTVAASPCDDITISGNTISENGEDGIEIAEDETTSLAPTKLAIAQNDIMDNEDDGVVAESWDGDSSYIMYNNISGNEGDSVVNNDPDTADTINARFNWWGTDDDDDFDEKGNVDVEPWLMGDQATTITGPKAAVNDKASLDAKDDCGVKISGVDDDAGDGACILSAFQYASNPKDDIADAIAFYDVFIEVDNTVTALDEVNAKIRLYDDAIDEGSVANFWTGDFWAECSDQEARMGVVYVTLTEDTLPTFEDLEATPFAVVAGEVEEDVFAAPTILAPETGADDVSTTPTLVWSDVDGAVGYYLHMADNPNFVAPIVKLDGELGRLIVTAYNHVAALPYSTPYYWRVKAVSATEESDWATGVFITMPEPEEEAPPIVIEEAPPAPIINPIVEVITPPATPITPLWIYVIIGVGAVMIIAVIVLIVRTRRVA
jgi:hypothetical protein